MIAAQNLSFGLPPIVREGTIKNCDAMHRKAWENYYFG